MLRRAIALFVFAALVIAGCCRGAGGACTGAGDCCSGLCTAGQCVCHNVGEACSGPAQCCDNGLCRASRCCAQTGGACTKDSDCCPMIESYTQVAYCDPRTHQCVDNGCVKLGGFCDGDYNTIPSHPPCCGSATAYISCGAPWIDPMLTHQCYISQYPACAGIGASCKFLGCCPQGTNCDPTTKVCVLP